MQRAQPTLGLLRRQLKASGKRLLRRLFEAGQRVGFDLLPRHFYSEIPDIRALRAEASWRSARSLRGIDGLEIQAQGDFIRECCIPEALARLAGRDIYGEACRANGAVGFGPIEAAFLYCVVAARRPPRVVQVGAGVSTAVVLAAAADAGHHVELTCIDPFPTPYLEGLASSGQIELIAKPVQLVAAARVADVEPGGMLFIDSTHTVQVGSDVSYLILEVLPAIRERVLVHFHDILLPYDYSPTILTSDLFFPTETTLLAAFLTGNAAFRVLCAMSMVHHAAPELLQSVFPWYRPARHEDGLVVAPGDFPASLYLEASPPGATG